MGHCQKEDAKSVHAEKRAENYEIEIFRLIFMLTSLKSKNLNMLKSLVQHCKFRKFGPNS